MVGLGLLGACSRGGPVDDAAVQEAALMELLSRDSGASGRLIFVEVADGADAPPQLMSGLRRAGYDVRPRSAAIVRPEAPQYHEGRELASVQGAFVLEDSTGKRGSLARVRVTRWLDQNRAEAWAGHNCRTLTAVFLRRYGRWRMEKQVSATICMGPNPGIQPTARILKASRAVPGRG